MTTPSISDLSALREVAERATPGRRVQFHPSYCPEAKGAPFGTWDTSHDVSIITPSGTRMKLGSFKHADDAAFADAANPQTVLALLDLLAAEKARADAAEAERNTFKAKDASKSKLLERFRDLLLNMCDHFEDEGDRVYFGSTNDPDELREIAREMDAWKWDAIMGQTKSDPYADLRELRATISTLTAERDALIRERDEARAERNRLRNKVSASALTDAQLVDEDYAVGARIDQGFGEGGGSPGEWWYERADEIDHEQKRRVLERQLAEHNTRSALSGAKDEREG